MIRVREFLSIKGELRETQFRTYGALSTTFRKRSNSSHNGMLTTPILVAPTEASVGETGTGKELVPRCARCRSRAAGSSWARWEIT